METSWTLFIVQTLIATLLSGSIVGLVLKAFLDRNLEKHRFIRDWKERSLASVVGPVVMHLDRTKQVADRYRSRTHQQIKTSYLEAELLKDSNQSVQSILLSNGHLLPAALQIHAHRLVAHYDVWLRRFKELAASKPDADAPFDVGFSEIKFPEDAAEAFKESFQMLQEELYGFPAAKKS